MSVLDSAAQVLRSFSAEFTAVTVTEISQRLAMPKSNASRLLRAMRDCGMLETIGDTKRFRPGPMLHSMGRIYRASSMLLSRAEEVVTAISLETGHTGYVSKREGREVMAVTDHPGTNTLRVSSSIGRRLAAQASATGRSLLARLTDDEVRSLFTPWPEPPSPSAPQSCAELIERLTDIRRTGYALSSDESNRGVAAIGVAVGDPDSGDEVSLCIACPVSTTSQAELEHIAQRLLEGAHTIASVTGDPHFPVIRPAYRMSA